MFTYCGSSVWLQVEQWCCWSMNMCLDGFRETGKKEREKKNRMSYGYESALFLIPHASNIRPNFISCLFWLPKTVLPNTESAPSYMWECKIPAGKMTLSSKLVSQEFKPAAQSRFLTEGPENRIFTISFLLWSVRFECITIMRNIWVFWGVFLVCSWGEKIMWTCASARVGVKSESE